MVTTKVLLKDGYVLNFHTKQDILIEDGKIVKIQEDISESPSFVFDCKDLFITEGLIDLHTHIRHIEKGEGETMESITDAAIKGGFTTICIMPNTEPVIDNPEIVREIKGKKGKIEIFPIGAIAASMGQNRLSDIEGMKKEGIFAISDDGFPINDKYLLKDAMEIAKELSLLVILHCEDKQSPEHLSEAKAIERNISLSLDTNCRLHIAHISTKDGISLVKEAKKVSKHITCEATPHHFSLHDIAFNVKPPIRSLDDKIAVCEGLSDGTIDIIATDHAPHLKGSEKPGISGIETCISLVITELVNKGYLSLEDAISKLTKAPSKIIGLEREIKLGSDAYLTIIDLKDEWVVKEEAFSSKGKNTPFSGWRLKGKAKGIISYEFFNIL